jgi:starch phosphorylase
MHCIPEKFVNVTNGVTPRRWVKLYNPALATLLTSRIGDGWVANYETEITKLESCIEDVEFRKPGRK